MKQQTPAVAADQGFEQHCKPTRRDEFLDTMHRIVPWAESQQEWPERAKQNETKHAV
jgi:hypothetical protein